MKMSILAIAAAIGSALFACAVPALAHHSFAAEFDSKACRAFTGVLTKLDWQSPHPYFYMDVKDANGKVESWSFQTYAPITLRRNGTDRQLFIDNLRQRTLELHPNERAGFLDATCGSDADLRREIETLLKHLPRKD